MKEINDILRAYELAVSLGQRVALATVVHVEGSSYRRPGARMLVNEDGTLTGAISGGCLEGDALRKAQLVIVSGKKMLVTYDTNDEDDAKLGMGLGCNGIIQVLIEPIDKEDKQNPLALLRSIAIKRQNNVLVTLFSLVDKRQQPGTTYLLQASGTSIGNISLVNDEIHAAIENAFAERSSVFKNYTIDNQSLVAFVEFIKPPVSLVIVGAGNDVMPLVDMSAILGWEAIVVDGRGNYAKAERFPSACKVLVAKPEDVLKQVAIDDQTVFALMTHNYIYDMAMLKELVQRGAVYIGLLGPKKKRDRMINEPHENGMQFTEQQLATIHGPVGLDIGAETPEEIALSIIAEIQSFLAGRNAKQLKMHKGVIHPRSQTAIK